MTTNKTALTREIATAFSLSDEAAQTACLLLEARARTLDFTFDEYMQRYHPEGFAEKDENLGDQFQGYVQFLGDDASAILRAGKSANFSTLVHECAHVFRRQLTGELREQAEKAFGIEGGTWNVEKEELFAKGLEQWIKRKRGRDKTRADVYNKGKNFVDTVYRGMERIVEIDSRMEEVYERLFEDNKYTFKQNEYEKALKEVAEGKLPNDSHIFLGMTPRIYEELGFLRLPMAMTKTHLYSTFRANGEIDNVNYHDLGEEILRQLPEQLKKPLCIIQADNNETDIISIITLKDKENNQIIVPVAHSQKGNFNGAEIDINLVKTVFGKDNFENWLKEAIDDNRLLYIDKKKTEPIWMGQGFRQVYQHFPDRSIRLPDGFPHSHTAGPTTDVFGFLPENIAHYQEAVKRKFPERFAPAGEHILYKSNDNILYIDKKKTEPIWMGQGFRQVYQHFPDRAILPPGLKPPDVLQNISGFIPENITHYKEAVKQKYPERFTPSGERPVQIIPHSVQLETARKIGYVQGVCESVAAVGGEKNMAVKLLSEMRVTKDMAKKFANPETYKTLEQGIFAQKQEQKLEQTRSRKL